MARRQSFRREGIGILQAVVLGLTLAFYVGFGVAVSTWALSVDFMRFYESARSVFTGDSIYTPSRTELDLPASVHANTAGRLHPNLNPPFLAVLLAPATLVGVSASYIMWTVLSILSGLVACVVLWRGLRDSDRSDAELAWVWIALFLYFPTCEALALGQLSLVTLLLLASAWYCARCGRDGSAGLIVGLAVSLKVFVALVVIFFALRRRWRIVAWSLGTVLIIGLATLPVVGFRAYVEYFATVRTVTWFSNSHNASFASFITRVLGGSDNVPLLNLPALAQGLVLCGSAVTLLWLARAAWPRPDLVNALERFDLAYGLTLVVMLLVSPLGWMYYFPILIIPGYAVWSVTRHGRMRSMRRGLIVAWTLSSIPTVMVQSADANDPARWFTINSIYFYALLLLAIVLSRVMTRLDSQTGAPHTVQSRVQS